MWIRNSRSLSCIVTGCPLKDIVSFNEFSYYLFNFAGIEIVNYLWQESTTSVYLHEYYYCSKKWKIHSKIYICEI